MEKKQYDANDAKLKELVEYLEAPNRCLILRTKDTGSSMTVRDTMVTSIVLEAMGFLIFVHTLWC